MSSRPVLFVSTPLLTLTFGREWGGQRKAFRSGAVVEQGPWDRRKRSPFAGRRGMPFQDPVGRRFSSVQRGMLVCGRRLKCQVVPTMAAGREAPGQAQSDLGLGGLGILGRRTGLGGAHWGCRRAPQRGSASCPSWRHGWDQEPMGLAVWRSPPARSERQPGLGQVGRDC